MLFVKEPNFNNQDDELQDDFWRQQQDDTEGHLAIDVYQKPGFLVVCSTIAGARAEDLEVIIDDEMLTIRGVRRAPEQVDYQKYLYRECYWGKFSRTIILPTAIDEDAIESDFENGVLMIILPEKNSGNV